MDTAIEVINPLVAKPNSGKILNRIALLGAGFTRYWGGLLASEVDARLLGRVHDVESHGMLQLGKFEDVLGQLQNQHVAERSPRSQERLDIMQRAIVDAFHDMNAGLARVPGMDFTGAIDFSVRRFLGRFDAIFTLSQDPRTAGNRRRSVRGRIHERLQGHL